MIPVVEAIWQSYSRLSKASGSGCRAGIKKPASAGFFGVHESLLLDFGFLVLDVLANHGIVFLEYHLVRSVFLVLVGGVVVACASGGYQFDQISHDAAPST